MTQSFKNYFKLLQPHTIYKKNQIISELQKKIYFTQKCVLSVLIHPHNTTTPQHEHCCYITQRSIRFYLDFIFIEKHVGYASCNGEGALSLRTYQASAFNLNLHDHMVNLLQEVYIICIISHELFWQKVIFVELYE